MIPPHAQCQRNGCTREGTHLLKLCVPALGMPDDAGSVADLLLGVRVCEPHLDETEAEAWVTGETGQAVCPVLAACAGRVGLTADFSRAWIVGVSINSPEARPSRKPSSGSRTDGRG